MPEDNQSRRTVRMSRDLSDQISHFAKKHSINSNDYICEAIREKIDRENRDYDLPAAEILRLNQLCARMDAMTLAFEELSACVFDMQKVFSSLAEEEEELLLEERRRQKQKEEGGF